MSIAWPAVTCFACAVAAVAASGIDSSTPGEVKSAYVRHIADFTSWPSPARSGDEPIVVCVLGADVNGVAASIQQRLERPQGIVVQGRQLALADLNPAFRAGEGLSDALEPCYLLFVSADFHDEWPQVADLVAQRPLMTVSEFEGFVDQQGMVELFVNERRVRLRINEAAVRRAGLRLSSRLLRLSVVEVVNQ